MCCLARFRPLVGAGEIWVDGRGEVWRGEGQGLREKLVCASFHGMPKPGTDTVTFRIPTSLKNAMLREAGFQGLTMTGFLVVTLNNAVEMRARVRAALKDRETDAGMLPESEYNETPQGKARLARKANAKRLWKKE